MGERPHVPGTLERGRGILSRNESHRIGMGAEIHNMRTDQRAMEKGVHFNVPIEVLRGPGAKDRGAWFLRKLLKDAAINANFIDGPQVPSGRPPTRDSRSRI